MIKTILKHSKTAILLKSFVVALFILPNKNVAQALPFSDPQNAGNWIINEAISDEFEISPLNETKWLIQGRNGEYQSNFYGRPPSQFSTNNVRIEDNKLKLETRWEPDYNFSPATHPTTGEQYENLTTAAVISKKQFHYGYMEIKCKAADAEITSSFWTTGNQSELDMFEMFGDHRQPAKEANGKDKELKFNIISWNPQSQGQKFSELYEMDWRVADDFHVYGFEWDSEYIKVYADGELVSEVLRSVLGEENWVTNVPYWIWVDQETFPWHGVPDSKADLELNSPEDKKDDGIVDFEIEYIRVWEKKNLINTSFFGFESSINIDGTDSSWFIPGGSSNSMSLSNEKSYRWATALKFSHSGQLAGNALAFAPFGSVKLESGEHKLSLKVWLEPSSTLTNFQIVLENPFQILNFNVTGIETGKWITLTQNFNRTNASDDNDRLRVRIIPADAASGQSTMYIDDIFINSNAALSIDNSKNNKIVSTVFPNPVNSSTEKSIQIASPEAETITIFNLNGAKLKEIKKTVEPMPLDISNLNPGIYFLNVASKNKVETKKIIIK